jgi:hypothetical protein
MYVLFALVETCGATDIKEKWREQSNVMVLTSGTQGQWVAGGVISGRGLNDFQTLSEIIAGCRVGQL